MIAQRYRFHGHNALSFAYKQGRTARSSCCLLRYTFNPRRTDCRVAVVISKKVHKSAVVRNRLRRRIFAVVQGIVTDIKAYDLIFTVVDPAMAELSKKDINNIIIKLLQMSAIVPEAVDKSDG